MNIYITNDGNDIACTELFSLFGEFGKIRWTKIGRTSSGNNYALVEMTNEADARNAVSRLDGMYWHDSLISVSLSCLQIAHIRKAEKNIFFI